MPRAVSRSAAVHRFQDIGVPREIKIDENRVALTPVGAAAFVRMATACSCRAARVRDPGLSDQRYRESGAS
jgi:alanine dehydrogenase